MSKSVERDRFFVTTAIPYMNSHVHIGNCLEYVLADALARAARLRGEQTYLLTGTDEHGQKIVTTAKDKGVEVGEFVQSNVDFFQSALKELNVSYDDFIRTSDQKRHWPVVQAFWRRLKAKGDLYEKEYEGLYCIGCEAFYREADLVDGKCPIHVTKPELTQERNWFFKLSRYQTELADFLKTRVEPRWRANEMLKFLEQGLEDISFSRPKEKLNWGIPVPDDDSQLIYVWCDALVNYLSAVTRVEVNEKTGVTELNSDWWPAQVHVVGKDIAKFHTLYWPAMLLSAGLALPEKVLMHGFITINGQKISKSLGNVIEPKQITETYGADALRFYFLHEVPTVDDGDFSLNHLKEVYNGVLADGLGNLVQRLIVMSNKYEVEWSWPQESESQLADQEVLKICSANGHFEVQKALDKLIKQIEDLNRTIQQLAPWELFKTEPDRARAELTKLLDELARLAVTLEPFLPATSAKIITQLKTRQPEVLFPKID